MARWIAALLLALLTIPSASAQNAATVEQGTKGATLLFRDADVAFSTGKGIPASGWKRMVPPTAWFAPSFYKEHPHDTAAWGRWQFDRASVGQGPLAIYTENNRERFVLYVNGADIFRNYPDDSYNALGWNRPYLVHVPERLLRPGMNEIVLRVDSGAGTNVGLGKVRIGPASDLRPLHDWFYFWRIGGPQIANWSMLILSLGVFLLWLGRRSGPEYLWLVATGLFWFLRDFHFFAGRVVGPPFLFSLVSYFSLYFAVAASLAFAVEFLKLDRRKPIIYAMIGLGLALVLFRWITWGERSAIASVNILSLIGPYAIAAYLLYLWRKSRDPEQLMMAIVVGVPALHGIHDIGRIPELGWWDGSGFHVQPYIGFLLFATFLLLIGRRFLIAQGRIEGINVELAEAVDKARSDLVRSESARRELEVARAVGDERERMMREMHDGIGSNLVTALAVAKKQQDSPQTVSTIKRALGDLKLTVDSLAPVNGDVVTLLANLRHRMRKDLTAAGIETIWLTEPCPQLDWLTPENALQMLRIVQEAIGNVLSHASASQIVLRCEPEAHEGRGGIGIRICDNGAGFDPEMPEVTGHGIANMRTRAAHIGAALAISSQPGKGSEAWLWLPLILDSAAAS
jgi:signal transduction histidine kinase